MSVHVIIQAKLRHRHRHILIGQSLKPTGYITSGDYSWATAVAGELIQIAHLCRTLGLASATVK